jgi:predicted component of type VI protein secretion system
MALEADSDFHKLFGEAFGEAYEEQVERLRQSHR